MDATTVNGSDSNLVVDNEIESKRAEKLAIFSEKSERAKLINRLTINDLTAIQDAFFVRKEQDEAELTLDKGQFCELLSIVLSKGTKKEYEELFDKADVGKEGLIDWDKLCSHLLLQYYEKDDRMKTTQVPQWKEVKYIVCPHKDAINRFTAVRNPAKSYLSVSREGTVAFWNLDMKLVRSLHVHTNPEEIKPRDLWVTHFTPMSHINKLAITLTSKEIAIYDLSSKTEFTCQYKICGLSCTPICLDYWSNPNKSSHSILSFADTGGNVHAIVFSNASIALFERPLQPAGSKQDSCLSINIHDIAKCMHQYARYYQHSSHNEWVRKIQYAPILDCFISCSTTSSNSMALGWLEKGTMEMRTTTFNILQGLNSFDFNPKLNLIATAGINTQVCLWNPYVISKPVGILQGHMQSVIAVLFIQNKNQLMSLSKEKVLRIWDTHLQVCLQRLSGMFPKINDAIVSMYFDSERSKLFTSFNNQLTLLSMKAEIRDRVISHENAVTAVVYNRIFNQIISVCAGSVITMWMIGTGQKVKQFANAHGTSEITCLSQDTTGMRLLTGSADGTIKIWDFNGQCHHILMAGNGNPCEISQIMYLKRSIIAVGWDRSITCFPVNLLKTFYVYPIDWKGRLEHQDDILTATFHPPKTLATGGFDGDIVLWNVITENAYRHLSSKKNPTARDKSARQMSSRVTSRQTSSKGRQSALAVPGSLPEKTLVSLEETDQKDAPSLNSYAVTSLLYLQGRPAPTTSSNPANLVSCTNEGLVVFWNTFSSRVAGEFVAHNQVTSLTIASDEASTYLVSGDSDGVCKVWQIESYCQHCTEPGLKTPPRLYNTIIPHSDAINCIIILALHDTYVIVTGSNDCCVSMHTVDGLFIGTFGQEQHWNLDETTLNEGAKCMLIQKATGAGEHHKENEIEAGDSLQTNIVTSAKSSFLANQEASDEFDLESRVKTWDNTILGKFYQKRGNEKPERKQPYLLPYMNVERGQHSISAFQALNCNDLTDVPTLLKPDFVFHPEKYFTNNADQVRSEEIPCLPPIVDSLQQRHDEKSLFPKSILEEMRIRNASQAFSSYSRHGKSSNNSMHQPLTKSMSVSSTIKTARPYLESGLDAKEKKTNVWNKKILGKIKSVGLGKETIQADNGRLKAAKP